MEVDESFDYERQQEQERREQEEPFVPWLREQRLERERWSREFLAENKRIYKQSAAAWDAWAKKE